MDVAFLEVSFSFERPCQPAPSVLINLINFPSYCPRHSSVRKMSQSTISSMFSGTDIATLIFTWFTPATATVRIAFVFLKEVVDSLPTQISRSAVAISAHNHRIR